MEHPPISRLMYQPNYARPMSRAGRYVSRAYRYIIALLVSLVMVLATLTAFPTVEARAILLAGLAVYGAYTLVRQRLRGEAERRWYTPRVQFLRGQIGIAAATIIAYYFAAHGHPNLIWPVYLLSMLIISEHCSTPVVIGSVMQVGVLLASVLLLAQPHTSPSVTLAYLAYAAIQWLWIVVIAFILHYLVRNVNARDAAIERYQASQSSLLELVSLGRDPTQVRRAVLESYLSLVGADAGSLWIYDHGRDCLTLGAGWMFRRSGASTSGSGADVLAGDSATLPAHIIRTQRPGIVAKRPGSSIGTHRLLPFPPTLAQAQVEFALPIVGEPDDDPAAREVICFDYMRPIKVDELEQAMHSCQGLLPEMASVLNRASSLAAHLVKREVERRVTHSLDRDVVLRDLVDVATSIVGFDFATVSLIDEDHDLIRTVYASPQVDRDWIKMASHPLASADIQAHVVRTGSTEILRGWDSRFDKRIWNRFGHEDMLRAWIPLKVTADHEGKGRPIGTLEVGYFHAGRREITEDQIELLAPAVRHAAVAINNAQHYARLRKQAEALSSLHRVTQNLHTITSPARLSRVLRAIGQAAEEILDADVVMLYEYGPDREGLSLGYLGGDVWGKGDLSLHIEPGSVLRKIITEKQPHYSPDARQDPLLVGYHQRGVEAGQRRTFAQRQNIKSFAGVPLMVEDQVVGVLCVNYRSHRSFAEDDRDLLDLFARQAALAKENARLYAWAHESAKSSERGRLSRELHHSVSQELYGLELKARTALSLVSQDVEAAATQLHQIIDIADAVKNQVGFLISELRPTPDTDFADDLCRYVSRMRQHFGMDIDVQGLQDERLSPQAHFALIRIAHEALNNILHHARCHHVDVRYGTEDGEFHLVIQDDGVGFNLAGVSTTGRFGLANIREYAENVGGRAVIVSKPKHGTRVEVWVPS